MEKKLAKLAEQGKGRKDRKTRKRTTSLTRSGARWTRCRKPERRRGAGGGGRGLPNEPIDIDDVVRDAEARQAEPISGAPGMVVISRYPAAGLRGEREPRFRRRHRKGGGRHG